MHKKGIEGFPYFVGIDSLEKIATREDKICVLNILGGESSKVTPVSHVYSGGNIVFGTGPGRSGKVLETSMGNIPVFNSIKEGMSAGHRFNTAVIYLPPSGVKDGVAEAVRHNPDLKKIVIITEKVSLKDSRIIRAICQTNGVDVFGANCLGVGDSWNKVRIGGALGGSKPDESLVKGSIALFSNSGNFTTTIAVYLLSKGWGNTTCVSSGKDVYIHFGPREFLHAFNNDKRSKGAVMYVEPGGYYEHGLTSEKPFVVCVVGRWKARFTRACGHAGSLAGSGDDAMAKEKWFMDYFGVNNIFTPEKPVFSKKGAIVTNIAHIPQALTLVMAENGVKSDFEPKGDLSLKCWMGNNQGLKLPKELDISIVSAVSPYNEQIEALSKVIGAQFPRQTMKDTSGASFLDPKSQVTKFHNMSILDASRQTFESNLAFSLLKSYPDETGTRLVNIALNAYVNMHGDKSVISSDAARESGSSPNTAISAAVASVGKNKVHGSQEAMKALMDLFVYEDIKTAYEETDLTKYITAAAKDGVKDSFLSDKADARGEEILNAISKRKLSSIPIKFLRSLAEKEGKHVTGDALLAAIWLTLAWEPLKNKKVSLATAAALPWYSVIFSTIIGCSANADKHKKGSFYGVETAALLSEWTFTETAFLSLIGRKPTNNELFEFSLLLGLTISNGVGTISIQGAKGAVSADGPEQPERVQINKCFIGFLTHTGFAHGGNGYEAIKFLLDRFRDQKLSNPGDPKHSLDIKKIAKDYAEWYQKYKNKEKTIGNLNYLKIPCINHPVFKGKPVNIDPREEFISKLFVEKGIYNIFLDFYHGLVKTLFETGVTNNVYCVNIDAVIAVILLKVIWEKYKEGKFKEEDIENAAFTVFLFGRTIGSAAEIDDHINRGKDMDTRTPTSSCAYIG